VFVMYVLLKRFKIFQSISILNHYCSLWYTIFVKSFKGGNFCGFRGFLLTANVLPLKNFLECQCHPLTTQSMVPPHLTNNEQSIKMLPWHGGHGLPCYHFLTAPTYRSLGFPSSLSNHLFSNHWRLITADKTVSFEFSYFFCHSTRVKTWVL